MELLNWFFECIKAKIVDLGMERGEVDVTKLFTQSHAIAPDYNMMFARMAHIWAIRIYHEAGIMIMYDM